MEQNRGFRNKPIETKKIYDKGDTEIRGENSIFSISYAS